MRHSTAISEQTKTKNSKRHGLRSLLSRLQDPKDVQAASFVAIAILVFEAGICPLIIAKIPCKFKVFVLLLCIMNRIVAVCDFSLRGQAILGTIFCNCLPQNLIVPCRYRAGLGGIYARGARIHGGKSSMPLRLVQGQMLPIARPYR